MMISIKLLYEELQYYANYVSSLFLFSGKGQDTTATSKPIVFIDGEEVILEKTIIDPNHIDSINVVKRKFGEVFGNSSGYIYIYTKKQAKLVSLSLLLEMSPVKDSMPVRFIIDDKLIEDTTGYRIEPWSIASVEYMKKGTPRTDHDFESIQYIHILTTYRKKDE